MLNPPAPRPMPAAGSALDRLQQHLHHTRLLGSISSALYYDQNTVMPAAGAAWRGEQLALLAGQLHERQSSPAYADLVAAAEADLPADAPPEQRRNLRLLRLELERQRCLDPALVNALALAQSRGNAVWQDARQRNDFGAFAPALQELLNLRREQASQLARAEPVARSPWEVLAQPFEPDVSKARLDELFAPLKAELPALLAQVAATATPPPAKDDLPEVRVKVFDLLRSFGSDLRFRAVVCDKEVIRIREVKKRKVSPGYRYDPDALYDELARSLLGKFSRMADGYHLMIAKRGNRDRNAALLGALEQAESDFAESFGFSRGGIDA